MHLAEEQLGEFRVYAAALEVSEGAGFHAGVVVKRQGEVDGGGAGEVVFRDELLDEGAVWARPDLALGFGLRVGAAAIQAQAVLRTSQRISTAAG